MPLYVCLAQNWAHVHAIYLPCTELRAHTYNMSTWFRAGHVHMLHACLAHHQAPALYALPCSELDGCAYFILPGLGLSSPLCCVSDWPRTEPMCILYLTHNSPTGCLLCVCVKCLSEGRVSHEDDNAGQYSVSIHHL